jgi:hypothetical protein
MWYVRCVGWSALALFFWTATAVGFFGWGVLCRFALRLPAPTRMRRTNTCLFGVCGTLLMLQLAHCVVPVDALMLGVWSIAGLAGAALGAGCLRARLRWGDRRAVVVPALVTAGMLYVAYSAMTEIPQSDPYHFVAIRWQQAFPIVPGLANLDGRLGFNNASFLVHSLFSTSFEEFGLTFCHGALYLILLSSGVHAVARSAARRRVSLVDACQMLTLCPLLVIGLDYRDTFAIANVSPDLTLFLLQIALVRSWVPAIHGLASRRPGAICGEHLVLALLLAVACVCTKLSSAVFSAVLIGMAAAFLVKNQTAPAWHRTLSWHRVIAALVVFAAIWAGRGIVLSGHPLYPSSALAAPVEWRVAETMRAEELKMIADWGRYAQPMPGADGPWLSDWCRRFYNISWTNPPVFSNLGRSIFPVCLVLLGGVLWAGGVRSGHDDALWVPLFAAAGASALAVWFVTAPDPRFVVGIFYSMAIVFLAPVVCRLNRRQRGWLLGVLAATVGLVGLYDRGRAEYARQYSPGRVLATLLVPPPPNAAGRYAFPRPSLKEFRCDSGLTIYLCDYAWHAPLTTVETLYTGWNNLRLRSSRLGFRAGFIRS